MIERIDSIGHLIKVNVGIDEMEYKMVYGVNILLLSTLT